MHAVKYEYINFDDYLAGERDVDVRSEYVDGQIYAMSGASELHNTVSAELFGAILGKTPFPSQITNNGAIATMGTLLRAIT